MCGFLGTISKQEINIDKLRTSNEYTVCRGPDSKKEIFSNTREYNGLENSYNIHFLFNRLSILDLSDFAEQPMYSKEFNTFLMFNGEIFNHSELRYDLEKKGVDFISDHSDSEVVLLGISYFGIEYISKLVGQFSILFFNLNTMEVFLIRDRTGQKPLFYCIENNTLLAGSNLKSVSKLSKNKSLDLESLNTYLSLGVVPSPKTVFRNIHKVKPGEVISLNLGPEKITKNNFQYWSIDNFIDYKTFNEEEFYDLLDDAVKIRTNADVDVANFLSGGIDSTSIVKIQSNNHIQTNTFSVGFSDKKYDERKWFNEVADKYKTNHAVTNIKGTFSNDDVIKSIKIFDEPYADPSTVPSYVLSREISKHYKVAISGDGGDELFGGYTRTMDMLGASNKISNVYSKLFLVYPAFLGTGTNLKKFDNSLEDSYSAYFEDIKLLKLLGVISKHNIKEYFPKNIEHRYKQMQVFEYKLYLYEQMMLKIDRTSMANSLEVRSPFVDHRLIEYIIGHGSDYVRKENPKQMLKNLLINDFDNDFINRNKMGFVFNLEHWVYNNINLINDTINSGNVARNLNPNIVNQLSFIKSRINANRLWKLYFLEEYLNEI